LQAVAETRTRSEWQCVDDAAQVLRCQGVTSEQVLHEETVLQPCFSNVLLVPRRDVEGCAAGNGRLPAIRMLQMCAVRRAGAGLCACGECVPWPHAPRTFAMCV